MDLSTTYLGIPLPHPFLMGSSPAADDLDLVRRLEDGGSAAIVLRSLFEEQLLEEEEAGRAALAATEHLSAEATSYFYASSDFTVGPDEYLEQVRRVKTAVRIPVIASLNGVHLDRCAGFARQIQAAGADALELNVYDVITDPSCSGGAVEDAQVAVVEAVRAALDIPVSVKISPFYASPLHFVHRLEQAGARGVVLFNRFFDPDPDPESLEVGRALAPSSSAELPLRLRWTAILSGRTHLSLAVSGGVHTPQDALKAILAGADAIQVVSAVLRGGPSWFATARDAVGGWLEAHGYASLDEARGVLSIDRVEHPGAYSRANYIRSLAQLGRTRP